MKNPTPHRSLFSHVAQLKRHKILVAALSLAGLPAISPAQSTWNGSASTDWNTAANWSAGVPNGADAIIATTSPNIATISNTFVATPVDIKIGWFGGNGRVDHISGDAGTGNGNWMWAGIVGNQAIYNFADTRTTGGTFTGYGQGSGNFNIGGASQNGNLLLGLDNGTLSTLNINSSGTITGGGLFAGANGGANGIVNMDSGTANFSGEVQIGANFFNQGSGTNNHLNMSGGTLTADIVSIARGNNNASIMKGAINLTGGTLQSLRWFTLGFAGSASAMASVTNNGGTINVNFNGGGNMEMTVYDPINAYFKQSSGALNICNSANILYGAGGNNSGSVIFDHNNGTVTFYSDAATTVGGSGYLSLGQGGDSGTYAYNLNGGTLTVPSITRTTTGGSGTFNFNGGTLKPTATTATFMTGLSAANVYAGGAKIDTAGSDISIDQPLSGTGVVTKLGAGTLTLTGTNTYTGNTVISNGTLALSGNGSLVSQVIIPASRTFDVTALAVSVQNPVSGVGSVNGSVTSTAGMAIYPATDGTVGTLTFNNDLNLSGGGSIRLDLSTAYNSGNDQVVVAGNLTVSSATSVRIKALSGAASLSTVGDYVLCSVSGTTTLSSPPSLAWDGTTPANYLNFSVRQSGNNLVLHYTPATAPTVTATSTPAIVTRNQAVKVVATVTPGSGSVTNVQIDASQIGGLTTVSLVLSNNNVYTNTFIVASGTAPGVKLMTVVAQANTGLNSPGYSVTNTVVATNEVWTGAGANNNWSTSPNWSVALPASSGDAVTFAGTTRLAPIMDANFNLTGVTFDATAGSFNIGTTNSSTLTLTANGVLDLSANPQTLNVPLIMSAAQTFNAGAGTLIISNSLDKGGNLLTVTGAASTVISANISGSGSLFKKGSGTLTVPTSSTWDLAQAVSGGFSGPLISQAGTLAFNNGSVQTVSGELVIGGVITNGAAGNNAKLVVDNATLNISSWLSVGRGNGVGGVSSDLILTNGAVVSAQNVSAGYNGGSAANLPKGSVTLSDTSSLSLSGGNFIVGESDGSDMAFNVNGTSTVSASGATLNVGINSGKGALNVNGGSVSVGALRVGSGNNLNSTAQGTITVNSGTLSSEGDVLLGFAGSGAGGDIGKMIINGGTVNVATGTKRWFIMNQYDTCASGLDVNGGSLNINANTDIRYAIGNNTGTNVINLNSGAITFYSDNATTADGAGVVDMHQGNGATVQNLFNLNGGTLTTLGILSANTNGTRTFNFNGGTLKPTTDSVTLMDLGAGDAHAYVRTGGARIDTDGKNVIIATALEHNSADSTDGGLTKSSAGTLNLTGTNTYTGNTVIKAGTLELLQATLAVSSTVSISNAAALQLDFSTTNQVFGLVLNGVAQAAGVYNNGNKPSFITGTGSLLVQPIAANPTNITISVSGSTMTLSWPADHLGWILQQQTNSLSTGLSNNWVDVGGSATITSTNITLNPAKPTVFFRLHHP